MTTFKMGCGSASLQNFYSGATQEPFLRSSQTFSFAKVFSPFASEERSFEVQTRKYLNEEDRKFWSGVEWYALSRHWEKEDRKWRGEDGRAKIEDRFSIIHFRFSTG
jgi:hypothetical protein